MQPDDADAAQAADRPDLGRDFWEGRWSEVLEQHAAQIAQRPPSAHLSDVAAELSPGRALDAGCGHGSEALWLAARGWEVTAVDFSPSALAHGKDTAADLGEDVAARLEWVEGDLGTWSPPVEAFDLVISLYVHVAGSVEQLVGRLASGVAPGGTLLLVGHLPVDPATGAPSPAAGQAQVTTEAATAALDPDGWEILVAQDRPRAAAGTGADAVIRARRR
jgi:SAM-dependent methyltransferase